MTSTVPVAVAFSGGGFRASLAGLGVTRLLAQSGLLGQVRHVSSVSGGSWPAALLALNWDDLEDRGFSLDAVDDLLVRPFVDRVSGTSMKATLLRNMWRAIGPGRTRTDLFADVFDDWFGHGRTLGDLPDPARCRFTLNATNLRTGNRYRFEQDEVGDGPGLDGTAPPPITPHTEVVPRPEGDGIRIRVADALAASAAIPGSLAPQRLAKPYRSVHPEGGPKLVDGMVYDNLGIEAFDPRALTRPLIVSIDSGAPLHGARIEADILSVLKRSQRVIQTQSALVRRRWMVEDFRRWQAWRRDAPADFEHYCADVAAAEQAFLEWQSRKDELADAGSSPEVAGPRPPFPPDGARRGVSFALESRTDRGLGVSISLARYDRTTGPPVVPDWHDGDEADFIGAVAHMPMTIAKLDPALCRHVVYRSWWLTRAFLMTFHDDVVGEVGGWNEWYRGS